MLRLVKTPQYLQINFYCLSLIFLILNTISINTYSALVALNDSSLSEVSGQSMIQVNQSQRGNTQYTRVDMGLDIEMNATIDKVDLGNYIRNGNQGSDILIENLSFGYIDNNGVMHPFEIKDPFIEFAVQRDENGQEQLIGLRFGQSEVRGMMSNDIKVLSGKLNVEVTDYSKNLLLSSSNTPSGLDQAAQVVADLVIGGLTNLWGREYAITAYPKLMDNNGHLTSVRATQTGIPHNESLTVHGIDSVTGNAIISGVLAAETVLSLGGLIDIANVIECSGFACSELHLLSKNCMLVHASDVCQPLTKSRRLNIGSDNELDGKIDENPSFVKNQFISLSSKSVVWPRPKNEEDTSVIDVHANKGFYLYMPKGGVVLSMKDATVETEPMRGRYVNDYYH